MNLQKEIIIWRFLDGKIGHEKQSLALVKFLKIETKTKLFNIGISNLASIFLKYKKLIKLPKPDLIIGVGHKVHLSVLISKIIFGGKSIIIMKPTIPINWFDLCIIPEHDEYKGKGLIYRTKGALCDGEINVVEKNTKKSLILIGGISKNFVWDSEYIFEQIEKLISNNSSTKFLLSISRRTPEDFIDHLDDNFKKNILVYEYENVKKNWFIEEAKLSKYAWVTEDSISMIYELIASGSNITPIRLKNKNDSKISNEISRLVNTGLISAYDGKRKKTNNLSFNNEAKRCANFILNKWFKS